jgi:hypothetical protein
MKKYLSILLMLMAAGSMFAGTTTRDVVTTTAMWRFALTNETGPGAQAAIGLTPFYIISCPTNITVSASTSYTFPAPLQATLPVGTYYITCNVQGSSASTLGAGFIFSSLTTNIIVTNIVATNATAQVYTSGFLTVTNQSTYGFGAIEYGLDLVNLPTLSSNVFCIIQKLK